MSKFKVGDKVKLSQYAFENAGYADSLRFDKMKYSCGDIVEVFVEPVGAPKYTVKASFLTYEYEYLMFKDEELDLVESADLYSHIGDPTVTSGEEIGKPIQKVEILMPLFTGDVSGLTMTGNVVFQDKPEKTVGKFEARAKELGAMVDNKQIAYGNATEQTFKAMKVFLEPYRIGESYMISEELLQHILLQVRIMDKQSRIFSNPKADLMKESPYSDISGYGLLGADLQEKNKEE